MDMKDLPAWQKRAADWAADYHATLAQRPVRPKVIPGDIRAALPARAPEQAEPMERIFADFQALVPDAMTHWQHPRFFAYFPSNAAPASMLAEQLATAMAAQCMLWQTSPAATEMEEVVIGWLRDALGLAGHFRGTIHDTATTCTLSAVLTMRERALNWTGLTLGMSDAPRLRIYASAQTHSSVDKAVRLAGIGQDNLVKVPTDKTFSMNISALRATIEADKSAGLVPAGVVLCVGGTSIGASDPIAEGIAVAKEHGLYTHVDAAWAGSAMIAPEFRKHWHGVDAADSVGFNPHKWLGANFDCSVQFLADPTEQVRTMGLRPDYLQTLDADEVTNFNEWTVPLGRRFRALKLWFLLRAHGLEELRGIIRDHTAWIHELETWFRGDPKFEVLTTCPFPLFTFALAGDQSGERTEALLRRINDDGRIYLTQTRHQGRFVIRVTGCAFATTREDVMMVHDVAKELARQT